MKKLLTFLLLGILLLTLASALELQPIEKVGYDWDNVEKFTKDITTSKYGKYEIRNSVLGLSWFKYGKVADIELKNNSDVCGEDCFAEKEITLYEDGTLIDEVSFETLQEDGSWIYQDIRSYKFSYQGEIQDYKTICNNTGTDKNGTSIQECSQVEDGTHIGQINYREGEVVQSGTYLLRLDGSKKPSRIVDWKVKTNGVWTDEWAVWGSFDKWRQITPNTTSQTGDWEISNHPVLIYDGDWDTYGNGDSPSGIGVAYANYSFFKSYIPKLEYKDVTNSRANYTLPSSCINSPNDISLRFYSKSSGPTYSSVSCWNYTSSSWNIIQSDIYKSIYEAEIIWESDAEASITLNSPVDDCTSTTSPVTFNATAEVTGGATLINMSLFTNESGSWTSANTLFEANTTLRDNIPTGGTGPSGTSAFKWGYRFTPNKDIYLDSWVGAATGEAEVRYFDNSTLISTSSSRSFDNIALLNGIEYVITLETTQATSYYSSALNSPQALEDITVNYGVAGYASYTTEDDRYASITNIKTVPISELPTELTKVSNQTITDTILWNVQACDSDGDCGFATSNFTVSLDNEAPTISVESPSGTLGYVYIGSSETLNVTFTDSNMDSCWYNYNGTNITIEGCLTGVKNSTNFILEIGNTNITVYANDTIGNERSSFVNWSYTYLENNRTHNNKSYETASESFNINVEGPTSAVLFYNGTEYSTTKSGDNFNVTIDIPAGNIGNNSVHWRFDDSTNSFTSYQNVSETVFTICNSSYTTRFLNISFKDESDFDIINASISTSTFEYYLGDGTVTKTFNFINTTENFNYEFCATPNRTLNVDSFLQYKQGTDYPQRVADPPIIEYTNVTTNTILYLLSTIDGIFVTFQVINPANQVLSGVEVTATREIQSEDVAVGIGATGASGTVTFWLTPDFEHTFLFEKTGISSVEESFPPTQSSYTITMGGESEVENSTIRGIDYSITPINTFLENDTTYSFGFILTSSFWDVDNYGFDLRLADGTIITGDTTGTEGTQLTKSYNVNNQTLIYMDIFWLINGEYTNVTRYWTIQNTEYTGYSIAFFFTRLGLYMDSGLFGIDDFGRYLIAFVILFLSVGLMGHKFGISSPLGVLTLTFAIVFFLDVVTGIIPTIGGATNGIENLPTYLAGLMLTLAALNEVRLRI